MPSHDQEFSNNTLVDRHVHNLLGLACNSQFGLVIYFSPLYIPIQHISRYQVLTLPSECYKVQAGSYLLRFRMYTHGK